MAEVKRSRVAVLGTLAEFHREPIPYDMLALVDLVIEINPDLLCVDMTPEQWKEQDFSNLPPEYQEALLPLARQTDIVVAPIGGGLSMPKASASGWRGKVIQWLRSWIGTIQRTAPSPDAVNQGWRHETANYFYHTVRWLSGGELERATKEHTDHLTQSALEVAHRDPGARILVVVNIQYCHIIRKRMGEYNDVEIAHYTVL